jgi:hypothetical protein
MSIKSRFREACRLVPWRQHARRAVFMAVLVVAFLVLLFLGSIVARAMGL